MNGPTLAAADLKLLERRAGPREWGMVGILLVMYALSHIDRSIISLLVDPMKESLQIGDFQVSLLQGPAFAVFYAVFGLPMGWLVDRYSTRWVLWGGITTWSIAGAACGLARNFTQLAVARFGVGAGEATLVPAAYTLISTVFPRGRVALAIAIFTLGSAIGSGLAFVLGGLLIQWAEARGTVSLPLIGVLEPWQFAFVVTGFPGVFIALLAFLLPDAAKQRTAALGAATRAGIDTGASYTFRSFLKARARYFGCNLSALTLLTVVAYGAAAWTPVYLMRVRGLSVAEAGLLTGGISSAAGIAALLFAGWYSDRLMNQGALNGHIRLAATVVAVAAVLGPATFLLDVPLVGLAILFAITHFCLAAGNPVAAHIQITTPVSLRGRIAAVKIVTQHLVGLSLGPSIVGALTQFVYRDPKFVGVSIATVMAIILPVSFLLFLLGLKPAREAAAESQDW